MSIRLKITLLALLVLALVAACSADPAVPATRTALPTTAEASPLTATVTPLPPTPNLASVTLAPSPTATSEPLTLPTFILGDCRFWVPAGGAECGDLIVLEDRADPDGPTVSLHVAIFRSTNPNPAPDPVVYLMGGGGGNALGAADYYLRTVGDAIRESRDFIMYNQRGVHYNDPFLECPGEAAFYRELNASQASREETQALEKEFLLECRDHLLTSGHRPWAVQQRGQRGRHRGPAPRPWISEGQLLRNLLRHPSGTYFDALLFRRNPQRDPRFSLPSPGRLSQRSDRQFQRRSRAGLPALRGR